jgi:hypothetical protein
MSFHQQYYSSYESPYSSTDIILGSQTVKGETIEERFISGNIIHSWTDYIHRIYLVLRMFVLFYVMPDVHVVPVQPKSLVFLLTITSFRHILYSCLLVLGIIFWTKLTGEHIKQAQVLLVL